jgi:phenylalanyl-tRNA synthetase beta chain
LADALTFHAFEIESVEGDMLDVKITPNRGHDCLSYRGIANELSAILKLPLGSDPLNDGFTKPFTSTESVSVVIESDLCRRYIAGYVKGVKVGPSPEWLVRRLEAMGQKSINNVVDATNFVMFNIGQPLHAFDKSKTKNQNAKVQINIKKLGASETFVALDERAYELPAGMLVIADSENILGVAGVKGGKASGIDAETKDIILESANFDGASVRKTAKALDLRTDASQRFEQVISPELAAYGMRAASDLIVKLAGGEVVGFVDTYPEPQKPRTIEISLEKINQTLGLNLSQEEVADVFMRLGFSHEYKGPSFIISVPFERLDLVIPEDLIEEVGRIVGYDAVPAVELPPVSEAVPVNQNFAAAERVREELTALGYSEVFTSVFQDEGEYAVLNKVDSVRPFIRATLTHGLDEALKKNVQHKDLLGLKEVKLFEIGTVWKDGKEEMMVGIVSEKEKAKEDPLSVFVKDTSSYDILPLSTTERYRTFSRFPSITRDIAIWVPADTNRGDLHDFLWKCAGDLIASLYLIDDFMHPKSGRRSLAYRLVFQSFEKTLTDDEVKPYMEAVYAAVRKEGWEVR